MKIVSYIRVSTDKQGKSGLGLEAQQLAIQAYGLSNQAKFVAEYVEVESGTKNNRIELEKAIKQARVTGSRLVIAKLDRLSRNAAFLLTLQESGADFVCCDMPDANPLTIGIMAVIAQAEGKAISDRTKAAMQAAKSKGQTFGNPNGARALRRAGKGNAASCVARAANANKRALDLADVLEDVIASGNTTLKDQACELNHRGIKTAYGGRWHASSVSNLRNRLANLTPEAADAARM